MRDGIGIWARRRIVAARHGISQLPDAITSGALYTLLFATIIWLFGTAHIMIISPIVVIFRGRRRKMFPLSLIPRVIVTLLILNVLAHLATLNIVFCFALNILVPFLLVMVQASQFAPKAYFGYVMAFVFLELRPLALDDFLVQLAVTAYAACILGAVLLVMRWQRVREGSTDFNLAESLERLASLLDRLADGAKVVDVHSELTEIERDYDRLCINDRRLIRTPDATSLRYHLVATLFQRAIYLIDDASWQRGVGEGLSIEALHDVASMIRQVKAARTPEERAVVHRCLQMMLDMVELPDGRIRVFFRSILHILMLIVSDPVIRPRGLKQRIKPARESVERLLMSLNPDTFQFRFATRLAIVMTLTCSFSLLTGFNHAYWLPLNAFLLLMPSYEESSHRMATRPVGTLIGCFVSFLVVQVLKDPIEIYVYCMVIITLLYACTPGSWVQAIFATSFALTMCSLTMAETTAMALRVLYVCLAALIVLAVNRLVMPSTKERIYAGNRRQLFETCRSYWGIVIDSIDGDIEFGQAADMLSDFHLIYEQAYSYAQEIDDEAERTAECRHLVTLWHMFSEVEQIEYLVLAGEVDGRDSVVLRKVASRLGDKVVPAQRGCLAVALAAEIRSDEIRYALVHYIENALALT